MKLLFDTHALLWLIDGDDRLSDTARQVYLDRANDLYVSAASMWEIGIKIGIGKLTLAEGWSTAIAREMEANAIRSLPIELAHCARLSSLPFHHRDPFDRMLVAQALIEGMALLTADHALTAYEVDCIW